MKRIEGNGVSGRHHPRHLLHYGYTQAIPDPVPRPGIDPGRTVTVGGHHSHGPHLRDGRVPREVRQHLIRQRRAQAVPDLRTQLHRITQCVEGRAGRRDFHARDPLIDDHLHRLRDWAGAQN